MNKQTLENLVAILEVLLEATHRFTNVDIATKLSLPLSAVKSISDSYLRRFEITNFERYAGLPTVVLTNKEEAAKLVSEIKEHGWVPPSLLSKKQELDKKEAEAAAKAKAKAKEPKALPPPAPPETKVLPFEPKKTRVRKPKSEPSDDTYGPQCGPYKREPRLKYKIQYEVCDPFPKGTVISKALESIVKKKNIQYFGPYKKRGGKTEPWVYHSAKNTVNNISSAILCDRLLGSAHELCVYHLNTKAEMADWVSHLSGKQKKRLSAEQLSGPHPHLKEYYAALEKHPDWEGKFIIPFPIFEQEQVQIEPIAQPMAQ